MEVNNKGLLVVSFGTSFEDTRSKNIERVEEELRAAFPDRTFYHAYTSKMILKILKERDHVIIPTVTEAVQMMIQDGISDILVQPTHIINGIENDLMKEDILAFEDSFVTVAFGSPLLTTTEDIMHVTDALADGFPALSESDALLLMGHGSTHYANTLYAAADYTFKHSGHPSIHVATVESYPGLSTILPTLEASGVRHVYLAPFMLVAGDHATNDLAGDSEDSWNSILKAHGYTTTCILKGLGEFSSIRDLYVKHAKDASKINI